MSRTKGATTTMEGWMIANGKAGKVFYSDKQDKHLTAIASHKSRKIKTERIIALTTATAGKTPTVKYITKVTLL